MKLSEVLPQLTAKFPVEAHRERDLPGNAGTWWYLPWQTIRARLNEVVPDDWEVRYDDPKYLDKLCYVTCTLTICGVTRQAIGSAPIELISKAGRDMSRGNPVERSIADAFKNACEAFNIGAYIDDQADDRTKREFLTWMQRGGNGKAVTEYHRSQGNLPSKSAEPPKSQTRPFGQPSAQPKKIAQQPTNVVPLTKPVAEPAVISPEQCKRFWTIARSHKWTDEAVKLLIGAWGFDSSKSITTHAYEGLCAKLEDADMLAVYLDRAANEAAEKF